MGYTMQNGRWASTTPIYLANETSASANVTGESIEVGSAKCARFTIDVTAISGTDPSATVAIKGSQDETTWITLGSFTAATGTTTEPKLFPCCRFLRADLSLTGDDVGSNSVVVQTGEGPAVTVSGVVTGADAAFLLEITTGGHRGTADFKWSLDDGDTWEAESVSTGASVALGSTGVTAAFAAETAGANGTITKVGTGPDLTATGEPAGVYAMKVEITTSGGRGAGVFRWSDDDGATWEAETVTIAADGIHTLGTTGITATFADETYVDDETYSWATTAPVDYVDGTTYEFTSDDPDLDTVVTYAVTGEVC
jgi:hypothetical protein